MDSPTGFPIVIMGLANGKQRAHGPCLSYSTVLYVTAAVPVHSSQYFVLYCGHLMSDHNLLYYFNVVQLVPRTTRYTVDRRRNRSPLTIVRRVFANQLKIEKDHSEVTIIVKNVHSLPSVSTLFTSLLKNRCQPVFSHMQARVSSRQAPKSESEGQYDNGISFSLLLAFLHS